MSNAQTYRPMEVAQILDKTTLVITGPGIVNLKAGALLQILAVGREVPKTGIPLVLPKAEIRVTSVAGPYAIARTETYETVTNAFADALGATKRVTRRHELAVNEKELLGNPAATPVSVGDPVIETGDLSRFVAYLQSKK